MLDLKWKVKQSNILVNIGLGGWSPVWHQAITQTNADLLSVGPLGIKKREI